jgi:predicted GIY-YIG superfamily endonuclease
MFQVSLQQALTASNWSIEVGNNHSIHFIYVYTDGEYTFYVGRSQDPYTRLRQHIGIEGRSRLADSIGQFILDFRPESLAWLMQIYTLHELDPDRFQAAKANEMQHTTAFADSIEQSLIDRLHPCLNGQHNRQATALPRKYRQIANEGVVTIGDIDEEEEQ